MEATDSIGPRLPDSPFLMIASMDVTPEKEDLFNEIYDHEHVANLRSVPGVLSIVRYERSELTMAIGGKLQRVEGKRPRYHAIYGLESPDVLVSDQWSRAIEEGRWPTQMRRFTLNREHMLIKRRRL